MIYKNFQGEKLSELGFGLMRLPVVNGDDAVIDEAEAEKLIDYAYNNGINYFDTAWGYHDGNSELVAGKYLSKYPRESYKLASKFPGYDLTLFPHCEEIFDKQLEKCKTDYFDFYLFHNLSEINIDAYLDPKFHIYESLVERKRQGKIKHLGLSTHAAPECLKRFLDTYGDNIEFCQIQLNIMDWEFQRAKEVVAMLRERNIPILVMEPLRGGRILDMASVKECFDFVRSIDGVSVILSGMSTMDQLKDNIEIFSSEYNMIPERFNELSKKAADTLSSEIVPCTSCHYCTPKCPLGLDIPFLLANRNQFFSCEDDFIAPMAIGSLDKDKMPWSCIGCGRCKQVCPQKIEIPRVLEVFSKALKKAINY